MKRTLLAAALLSGCIAISAHGAGQKADASAGVAAKAAQSASDAAALQTVMHGNWRDPKNVARDAYRHPVETLEFFGLKPGQTVVEITPGGGWYSEILAPYLRDKGRYVAALVDPAKVAENDRGYQQRSLDGLTKKYAAGAAQYDKVELVKYDPAAPKLGADGSADLVLTFRNVHNWVADDNADAQFKAFFAVLKPGGVLGVVDHRARPDTDIEAMKKSGYLTEALVVSLAEAAGFKLDAQSEVNANPKDTKDHPNGVWTLPPSNNHPAADDAKYKGIGESDRMTLRFVKPK